MTKTPNDVLMPWPPEPHLRDEVTDAMWADYGRMVAKNIHNTDGFIQALTRASLKSKTTIEMLEYVRAYLLTGSR